MKTPRAKKNTPPRLLAASSRAEPTHDDIAHRAYSLWEQQGRPQDRAVDTWLLAEGQLRQAQNQHGIQA